MRKSPVFFENIFSPADLVPKMPGEPLFSSHMLDLSEEREGRWPDGWPGEKRIPQEKRGCPQKETPRVTVVTNHGIFDDFPFSYIQLGMSCHHSNWQICSSFFRGVGIPTTNQIWLYDVIWIIHNESPTNRGRLKPPTRPPFCVISPCFFTNLTIRWGYNCRKSSYDLNEAGPRKKGIIKFNTAMQHMGIMWDYAVQFTTGCPNNKHHYIWLWINTY